MPFTLAHPAAVLPLMRRPFEGLALVCGAMAPDVPYFIRATPLEVTAQSWYEPFTNATTTHSVAGLVPVTLLLAAGLYLVLRAAARPVAWLAHGRWDAPATPAASPHPADGAARLGAGRWAWVPVSLLVGALTHLVWDSATSSDGVLATRIDAVNETVAGDMTWIHLSQHASTAIGLTVLAVVLWRRRRSLQSDDPAVRRRGLRVIAGLATVGLGAGAVSVLATFDPSASPTRRDQIETVLSIAAKGAGVAVGIAVVLATAWWWSCFLRIGRTDHRPG